MESKILTDVFGSKFVLLPEIVFSGKRNIDWNGVENYLRKYVGKKVKVEQTDDVIYIGSRFIDEYCGSNHTKSVMGARAKAKANAVQGICEMVRIADDKRYRKNRKEKHSEDAKGGWYYYTTRFALRVYRNGIDSKEINRYSACIVVNKAKDGRMYLYDVVDIKKETSTPLTIYEW